MTAKVAKCTTKGQITLPMEWRKKFSTENFLLEIHNEKIIVKPIKIEELVSEDLIFDADRDNDGKGITPDQMIKMLKKVKNG
ncbi:hypothetical protein ACFL21_04000 [Patescibacteria group bacterium]